MTQEKHNDKTTEWTYKTLKMKGSNFFKIVHIIEFVNQITKKSMLVQLMLYICKYLNF